MFSSPDWTFEPKWDGFRVLAAIRDGHRLISRNGHSFTNLFGPVSDSLRAFLRTQFSERIDSWLNPPCRVLEISVMRPTDFVIWGRWVQSFDSRLQLINSDLMVASL